jgi:hypothetical protein
MHFTIFFSKLFHFESKRNLIYKFYRSEISAYEIDPHPHPHPPTHSINILWMGKSCSMQALQDVKEKEDCRLN